MNISVLRRFWITIILSILTAATAFLWFRSLHTWDSIVVNTPWNHASLYSEEAILLLELKFQSHGEWNAYHSRTDVTGHAPLWPVLESPHIISAPRALKILLRYGTLVILLSLATAALCHWELKNYKAAKKAHPSQSPG